MSAVVAPQAGTGRPWSVEDDRVLLVLGECRECEHRFFPPQEYGCERCGAAGSALRRAEVASRGTVVALVRVPRPDGEVGVAEVRLEAPDLRVQAPVASGVLAGDVVVARLRDDRVEYVREGAS